MTNKRKPEKRVSSPSSSSSSSSSSVSFNKLSEDVQVKPATDTKISPKSTKSGTIIKIEQNGGNGSIKSMVTVDIDLPDPSTVLPGIADFTHFGANLMVRYKRLVTMIESKDHEAAAEYLREHGNIVHTDKRKGSTGTPTWTRYNVANYEGDEAKDSPLIAAARVDCKMVELILTYGGNPNHVNTAGESPLSIAAVKGDEDTINVLMLSGANLVIAIIKLISSLRFADCDQVTSDDEDYGFSIKALTMLVSDKVFLKCSNPIRTAFDVSRNIKEIVDVRHEFNMDLDRMIMDTDVFAYNLLNECEKMWEAKLVLSDSHRLLQKAIDGRKKKFVSHPFSQQLIVEEWYGQIANKLTADTIKVSIRYLMSPLLIPIYFLHYLLVNKCNNKPILESHVFKQMNLLFTPFWCFVTDVGNYAMLLGLLIAVCASDKSPTPHWLEWLLWACVVSRILIEADQVTQQGCWRYITVWNLLEILTCILIACGAIYRIVLWLTKDVDNYISGGLAPHGITPSKEEDNYKRDILNITYLYAFAEFFLIQRWLNFLEIHSTLGPLMLAMKYMIEDVVKFVIVVLATCVFGATIAVYSICNTVRTLSPENKTIVLPDEFKNDDTDAASFHNTLQNIMWSTFGLLEMPGVKIEGDTTSTSIIQGMLVIYVVIACVMMLNMLIAMLSNAYERIQDNSDVEWKYARAELLKEYRQGQPFLFPFHLPLIPITLWYRRIVKTARLKDTKIDRRRDRDRDALMLKLCERYENNKFSINKRNSKFYRNN